MNIQTLLDTWVENKTVTEHFSRVVLQYVNNEDEGLLSIIKQHTDTSEEVILLGEVRAYMIEALQKEWEKLFEDCSTSLGKKLSKHERAALNISKPSLVYGEVTFASLGEVFFGPHLDLKSGGVFYDLGSGTGRGVFAAAYLHNFDKVWGIEILEGLTNASAEVLDRYDKMFKPRRNALKVQDQKIGFTRASFLDIDWTDADVIFANSTCFDEALLTDIREQVIAMKEGSYMITLTKRLNSPYFRLVDSTQRVMSWGYATVHLQQRLPPGITVPIA